MSATIKIDLNEKFPTHLQNWTEHYNMKGCAYDHVAQVFNTTTNGKIFGEKGAMTFLIAFENEQDYTLYMLRWL